MFDLLYYLIMGMSFLFFVGMALWPKNDGT